MAFDENCNPAQTFEAYAVVVLIEEAIPISQKSYGRLVLFQRGVTLDIDCFDFFESFCKIRQFG